MDEDKLKVLKKVRARKLGTQTRIRRRAFIILEAKGSHTEQLTRVLKELDLTLEAMQEAHNCTSHLKEEEDIRLANNYRGE